jgi:hypothetical protein
MHNGLNYNGIIFFDGIVNAKRKALDKAPAHISFNRLPKLEDIEEFDLYRSQLV